MKYTRTLILLLIFGGSFLIWQDSQAQSQLSNGVIGNGGVIVSGNNNRLAGTVGQPIIGILGNSANTQQVGFWYQIADIVTYLGKIPGILPTEFRLERNYPNPFNPSTTIVFAIPTPSTVKLVIYDLLGREVTLLVDEEMQPGEYKATFNGTGFPSGIYFYRLTALSNENHSLLFSRTQKLMLVK